MGVLQISPFFVLYEGTALYSVSKTRNSTNQNVILSCTIVMKKNSRTLLNFSFKDGLVEACFHPSLFFVDHFIN